ncbi:hypothetical protein FB451DRAFT_1353730 [Mycena latifolia]|nr:hypothetical protein FB451DRAFT_1353730 [Mycena latifolia]
MSTPAPNAMHAPLHARQIASNVAKFKKGIFEDVPRFHTCGACNQPLPNPLVCPHCKVMRYCNISCQTRDWQHPVLCMMFQKLPDTEPQMRAIAQQFPWARLQKDGTFSFETLRASRNLLGTGAEFGWWTEQPCCLSKETYTFGFLLLDEQHLRDRAGWKLSDKETPWLDFSFGGKPPKPVAFEQNWASYYKWCGLPIESPAALLLHWPLTVYRLLTIAGIVPAPLSETRRQLTVHMLGIEREMDFLPIFGELALLLPNTDLKLVLFGPGAANLLKKAQNSPRSLGAQSAVFKYNAPKISGGGSIRISLCGSFWDDAALAREGLQRPDALVACNAGLSSYPEWAPVVIAAHAFTIPFAVTDYNEISPQTDIIELFAKLPFCDTRDMKLTLEEQRRVAAAVSRRYEVRLNPGISAVNGYEMVVSSA